MEYFRRLLGTLQETLDYVSSFTTYLLGEETHPGAEGTGHTRELERHSSRHNSEVETAHSGDISPHLDAFERPRTIEVTPFNQELRVASEAVGNGTQTTEAIPEPSKLACKCEAQEVYGQKLSETPQFLADAPKPSPTATMLGNERQRDLEGLALIQGLHQWEPEGTTLMEGIQPEGLEEVGLNSDNSPHWEPDRPMAGEGEQNGARGTDGAQWRELEGTVWTEEMEQKTPDWALFLTEQPCGTGEIKHGRLKAESQHLKEEGEKEEESEAEIDWGQQGEANEGIQQAMLERGETEGGQEGLLEEAIRRHWWEPGKTVMTFEEQDWDPKSGAEEGNSLQSGLEGAKRTEDHQQGEPEGPLRNEALIEDKRWEEHMEGVWGGMSERLVEEDLEEEVLKKTETRGEPEWTERGLWDEPAGSRASCEAGLDAGERIVGEPERLVEKLEKEEVVEVVMLEDAETPGNRKREPEGTERSLHEELMGSKGPLNTCLFGGEQIVGKPEKLTGEQEPIEVVVLEEAETGEETQPWEPKGSLHEEPKGSNTSLLGMHLFGGEQTVVKPEALTEDREEVAVVAVVVPEEAETGGHQPWEPEGNLHEEPKGSNSSFLDMHLFGGVQIVAEPEGLTEEQEAALVVLEEAESGGHQQWEPETKERSLQQDPTKTRTPLSAGLFGGEQIVVEPEVLTEEQEAAAVVVLEEADTGGYQPLEPETKERSLQQDPAESRILFSAGLFGGEQIVVEPEVLTEEQEASAVVVLEEADTGGNQQWEPETKERSLQQDPTETRTPLSAGLFGGEQIVEEPEVLTEQQQAASAVVALEEADTGGYQPLEPETIERSLQQDPTKTRTPLNAGLFGGEQIVVEPEALTEEQEAAAVVVLEEADTGGNQQWEPETKERSLQQDPTETRTPLSAGLSGGEQIVGEPEKMTEQQQEVVTVVVLEEAETGGHQPWEPEGNLHEEPMGSRLFAGPSTLLDEVLPLDTSAQKERVMLRRKSSIRRAPSLKKPRLPMETQPMETQPPAADLAEPVPSQPQAPRQPNPRRSGFGPMHPNMMAELQMRLRRPQ